MITKEAKERSPETIYLQWWESPEITWCVDRIDPEDVEYRRADLPPVLTPELRDAIVEGMIALIEAYSQENHDIEYLTWEGRIFSSIDKTLKQLSSIINGWVHVPEGADEPQFIPMDEWLKLYEEWKRGKEAPPFNPNKSVRKMNKGEKKS